MTKEHSALLSCRVIKPTACFQWPVYYKGLRFQYGEQSIILCKNLDWIEVHHNSLEDSCEKD
jgi:hypothetical protein